MKYQIYAGATKKGMIVREYNLEDKRNGHLSEFSNSIEAMRALENLIHKKGWRGIISRPDFLTIQVESSNSGKTHWFGLKMIK